jgi:hypothetical protein
MNVDRAADQKAFVRNALTGGQAHDEAEAIGQALPCRSGGIASAPEPDVRLVTRDESAELFDQSGRIETVLHHATTMDVDEYGARELANAHRPIQATW